MCRHEIVRTISVVYRVLPWKNVVWRAARKTSIDRGGGGVQTRDSSTYVTHLQAAVPVYSSDRPATRSARAKCAVQAVFGLPYCRLSGTGLFSVTIEQPSIYPHCEIVSSFRVNRCGTAATNRRFFRDDSIDLISTSRYRSSARGPQPNVTSLISCDAPGCE